MTQEKFNDICADKVKRILGQVGGRYIYIYGAGVGGKILLHVLKENGVTVSGFVDERALKGLESVCDIPVLDMERISPKEDYVIVSLMHFDMVVLKKLIDHGFTGKDFFMLMENENYTTDDTVYKGCIIGRYTYGHEYLLADFPIAERIGRFCSINGTARIVANHPKNMVSSNTFFYKMDGINWERFDDIYAICSQYRNEQGYMWYNPEDNKPVVIGNDVWIGANAVIMQGTHIGDGAIIGAGAIVTNDVDEYAIVGGCPARLIRYRFQRDIIEKLLKIKWWNWDLEQIISSMEDFYNPTIFVEKYMGKG